MHVFQNVCLHHFLLLLFFKADPGAEGEGGESDKDEAGEEKREDSAGQDLLSATPPPSDPVVPSSSTITSITQLEALMRVHLMMAQLHGLGSQLHFDLSMAALAYCSLIWKVMECHVPSVCQ